MDGTDFKQTNKNSLTLKLLCLFPQLDLEVALTLPGISTTAASGGVLAAAAVPHLNRHSHQ